MYDSGGEGGTGTSVKQNAAVQNPIPPSRSQAGGGGKDEREA